MKQRKKGSGIHKSKRGPEKLEPTKCIRMRVPESVHDDINKVVRRWAKKKIKQHKLKNKK